MSEKLKPCPFCGGKAITTTSWKRLWYAECDVCLVMTRSFVTEDDAINFWNRRVNHARNN